MSFQDWLADEGREALPRTRPGEYPKRGVGGVLLSEESSLVLAGAYFAESNGLPRTSSERAA